MGFQTVWECRAFGVLASEGLCVKPNWVSSKLKASKYVPLIWALRPFRGILGTLCKLWQHVSEPMCLVFQSY